MIRFSRATRSFPSVGCVADFSLKPIARLKINRLRNLLHSARVVMFFIINASWNDMSVWRIRAIALLVSKSTSRKLLSHSATRMDNQPTILYMEWSKNVRPVSKQESQEIEMMTAPDSSTVQLREEVGILKLKLEALAEQKHQLIHKLNQISDATAIARSTCEGLDDQCETIAERIQTVQSNLDRETAICEDLNNRIQRDTNRASLVDLQSMLQNPDNSDSSLLEYFKAHLASSTDPDDLLQKLAAFYDSHHRQVKENSRLVAQLKTTVQSVKKDLDLTEKRLTNVRRSQVAGIASVDSSLKGDNKKKRPLVVDRKTVPMKPSNSIAFANDDLGPARKRTTGTINFFN
jgi:hypothetical protein